MKLYEWLGLNEKKGEVGIEVELEGRHLNFEGDLFWNVTNDGSLRGNSGEWVLRDPVSRKDIAKAVQSLIKMHEPTMNRPYEIDCSDRCGVHIHINCQQLTFIQTMCFLTLYLAFEDVLMRFCGADLPA